MPKKELIQNISPRQRASQEIENVISESSSIIEKAAFVKVRAKAANLMWLQDQERSLKAFNELWAWIQTQDDKSFDREVAYTDLLKNLFPRDPKSATKLLEALKAGGGGDEAPSQGQSGGDSYQKRLHELASGLIEDTPATTANLIEQSISTSFSPTNLALLSRLRRRDSTLADGLVSRALESLRSRPATQALLGVYSLTNHIFLSGRASGTSPVNATGDSLQRQYFFTAHETLTRSLQESEQQSSDGKLYRPDTLQFRAFYQAQIAGVLSALASRYAPGRAAEINLTALKLSAGIPPQFAELAQVTIDRVKGKPLQPKKENLEATISLALMSDNFEEARRLLSGVEKEDVRKFFGYQIALAEFKFHMSNSNLVQALIAAKEVEDIYVKSYMFARIAKVAYKKGDSQLSESLLTEARNTLAKSDCNEKKALGMLFLSSALAPLSASESIELLYGGAACVGTLGASASEKGKKTGNGELDTLVDAPEIYLAFSAAGKIDLDNALLATSKIEDKATQLIARLSACEAWLSAPVEKLRAKSTKVARVP